MNKSLACITALTIRASGVNAVPHSVPEIAPDRLLGHIKVLSSDEFEGRAPGTRGEERSVDYVTAQFKELGLRPGNPDGSYIQQVPLVGITSEATATVNGAGQPMKLLPIDDFVAFSSHITPELKIENAGIVFVGYGVVAPEYGWDDYKDVDFEFSKLGVPSLYTRGGMDFVGKPAGFGRQKIDDYYAHHYHQVSDEIDPAWDLTGAGQDVELLFEVGNEVANAEGRPKWKSDSEFKARGDALFQARPRK